MKSSLTRRPRARPRWSSGPISEAATSSAGRPVGPVQHGGEPVLEDAEQAVPALMQGVVVGGVVLHQRGRHPDGGRGGELVGQAP